MMKLVKPSSDEQKRTKTITDTIELTASVIKGWKLPVFQREQHVTPKVREVAEEIKSNGGVLPGILTLGVILGEIFIVDGQHRLKAFELSGLRVGYVDIRMIYFRSLGEASEEFKRLNSSLVSMRPDDKMRSSEVTSVALQQIRRKCPFVGYDMIRRSEKSPVVSMSLLLRAWVGSAHDVPFASMSSDQTIASMTETETAHLIAFVTLCYEAWAKDVAYTRLWGALNLSLCGWLYRRTVMREGLSRNSRAAVLNAEQFRKALMALSASELYVDWLLGRHLGERDRSPAYERIKALFARRLAADIGRVVLPQPAWSAHANLRHVRV